MLGILFTLVEDQDRIAPAKTSWKSTYGQNTS